MQDIQRQETELVLFLDVWSKRKCLEVPANSSEDIVWISYSQSTRLNWSKTSSRAYRAPRM